MPFRWRVTGEPRSWTVTGPAGRRWTGFPTQRAAYRFAATCATVQPLLTQAAAL